MARTDGVDYGVQYLATGTNMITAMAMDCFVTSNHISLVRVKAARSLVHNSSTVMSIIKGFSARNLRTWLVVPIVTNSY